MRTYLNRAAVAAAAIALALPGGAVAQSPSTGVFKDGNDVYQLCTSRRQPDIDMCEWFLMGAHDMAKYYDDTSGNNTFCTPDGFNAARLREMMVAFWRDNPDARRYSASSAVRHVLVEAFPGACRTA